MQTKKLALSLSGGGARAFCYFGVIRELEAQGIKIDIIMAHSGAAIVLCFMMDNMTDAEIISAFSNFSFIKLLSLKAMFNGGFYSIEKLADQLNKHTKGRDIKDLPYRTGITVSDITDFNKPKEIVNWDGDMAIVSAISCAIGGLFPLYTNKEGRVFADGGYTSLFSANILREEGADVVLGLYPDGLKFMQLPGPLGTLARVMKTENSARELYERNLEPVDLELRDFETEAGLTDFKMAEEMYAAGRRKAQENMPRILELLS